MWELFRNGITQFSSVQIFMSNEKHFPQCLYHFAFLWVTEESLSFSLFLSVVYVLNYCIPFIQDTICKLNMHSVLIIHYFNKLYVFLSHLYNLCHIWCQPIAIQIFSHILIGLFVLLLVSLRALMYYGYNIFYMNIDVYVCVYVYIYIWKIYVYLHNHLKIENCSVTLKEFPNTTVLYSYSIIPCDYWFLFHVSNFVILRIICTWNHKVHVFLRA